MGPSSDFFFFWGVSLYDGPDGIVLGYFCPGLYLVRLLNDLLADMGSMLMKFGVPRIVQP